MENDSVLTEYVKEEQLDDEFVEWGKDTELNGAVKFESIKVTPEEWTNEPSHAREIENVPSDKDRGSKMDVENVLDEYSVKEEQANEDNFESNSLGKNEEIEIEFDVTTYPIWDRTENEAEQNTEESHDIDVKENVLDETHVKLEFESASNIEVIVDEPGFVSIDDFDGTREDTKRKPHEKQSKHTTQTFVASKLNGRYTCLDCLYTTDVYSNIKRHELIHKPRYDATTIPRHRRTSDYSCDMCGFHTIYKHELSMHKNAHETKPTVRNKSKKCSKKHEPSHQGPIECGHCGGKYHSEQVLKQHMAQHIIDRVPSSMYECHICDYKTVYTSAMEMHRATHSNSMKARFRCDRCPFRSKTYGNLKRHRQIHTATSEEVPLFKCDGCDFKTIHKSGLTAHRMRRHLDRVRLAGWSWK